MMGAVRKEASMHRFFFLIGAAALLILMFTGCSASNNPGGTGGAANSGAVSSSSHAGTGGFMPSGTGGDGGACVGVASKATPIPLDISVMLDQSGSMLIDAGNGMNRWQTVTAALTSF